MAVETGDKVNHVACCFNLQPYLINQPSALLCNSHFSSVQPQVYCSRIIIMPTPLPHTQTIFITICYTVCSLCYCHNLIIFISIVCCIILTTSHHPSPVILATISAFSNCCCSSFLAQPTLPFHRCLPAPSSSSKFSSPLLPSLLHQNSFAVCVGVVCCHHLCSVHASSFIIFIIVVQTSNSFHSLLQVAVSCFIIHPISVSLLAVAFPSSLSPFLLC